VNHSNETGGGKKKGVKGGTGGGEKSTIPKYLMWELSRARGSTRTRLGLKKPLTPAGAVPFTKNKGGGKKGHCLHVQKSDVVKRRIRTNYY